MLKKNGGPGGDALALTFVRIVTVLISMVIYKLLAVTFSVEEYGTYASAMLVSSTTISLTILGLTDAINYFYARDKESEVGKIYVYTIFAIQMVIGVVAAVVLILFRNAIAAYFDNPSVAELIPGVAFIPLLTNLINMIQLVFVAAHKAKVIAIRNLVISIIKIALTTVVCLVWKSIFIVVLITLVLDLATVVYMLLYCRKHIFSINLFKADKCLIGSIFKYSIPMAAFILTNAMFKNIDKLVIGALGTSEMMGLYSIAAKELPFDILTSSFLTVLVPYISSCVGKKDYDNASTIFSKCLQINYIITWIVAGGALVCSDGLMNILYDEKYLPALGVFCLYIVIDMMKFATISFIFSITNKAKELLCYSVAALVLNGVLDVVFFKMWGLIGPAIATVVVTLVLAFVIMLRSANILRTSVFRLLNIKQMLLMLVECAVWGGMVLILKYYLAPHIDSMLMFIIGYAVYVVPLVVINWRKTVNILKDINRLKSG